jgi:hypothetical protein
VCRWRDLVKTRRERAEAAGSRGVSAGSRSQEDTSAGSGVTGPEQDERSSY